MTATKNQIFTVMGATGHVGKIVADLLLAGGHQVRALGRNPVKLTELERQGAMTFSPAWTDVVTLQTIFEDSDAVFTMLPADYSTSYYLDLQDRVSACLFSALQKTDVKYIVNMSSIGAQLQEGTGPIKCLHNLEMRLNKLEGVNLVHLRAAFFMENLYRFIPNILDRGILSTPLRGDLQIPMVATRDVGALAAQCMLQRDFSGKLEFEFGGPADVTLKEATQIIGKTILDPELSYVQQAADESQRAMLSSGMKSELVLLMQEMYRSMNEDRCHPAQILTPQHRGHTTLGEFALIFKEVYQVEVNKYEEKYLREKPAQPETAAQIHHDL